MQRSVLGITASILLVFAAIGAYGFYYQYSELTKAQATLEQIQTEAGQAATEASRTIAEKTEENIALEGELRIAEEINDSFARQIEKLSGTVGTLEKLAKTDPELLAKYSKVYFLNENYVPSRLSSIDDDYGFEEGRTYEFHANAKRYLEDLLEEAEDDGLSLLVVSAYRSFSTQASLKSGYTVKYGTGANAFSAEQGYSEHQLGTAVDFTNPTIGGAFTSFDTTEEFAWLTKNAWKYGFILSYPKGNAYYQYEPWHWRFVGRELAERLHDDGEDFYDLDQRTIDQYLANLFE